MTATTDVKYAGFWRRFIAIHIDLFVIFTIQFCLYAALSAVDAALIETFSGALNLSYLVVYWLYFAGMECSSYQGTLGKVLVGIIVTDTDGNRISFLRATGRNAGKILSSLIFGIGYLLAAFTKRKQALHDMPANCLVIRERDSSLVKLFLIAILFMFLAFAMLFGFTGMVLWSEVKKFLPGLGGGMMNNQADMSTMFEPGMDMSSGMNMEPVAEQVKQGSIATSERQLNLQEYEKLLATSPPAIDTTGPATTVGPALLEVTTFFTDMFWLEVSMPPIPNFSDGMAGGTINIKEIKNNSGTNVYDPNHNFETDFFKRLSFNQQDMPLAHIKAIRQVNHKPGLDENSFAGLTGTLVLSLPISLESVTLTGGEEGQAKQVAGSTVSLSSINGSDVNINYQGQGQNFLGILGFNAAGQELESMSRSILSDTGPVDTSLFIQFQGEPASVEVLVASDIVEKSYPFVIKP